MGKEVNIAFLDIDGVLTEDFELKGGNFEYGRQAPFKENARENIQCLQYFSRCKFVISSSWRSKLSKDELEIALRERGLFINVYDITPLIGAERGQEIDLWLECNYWDNYIVIDDQVKDIVNWCKNIVKVDPNKGFTTENMNLGLSYLKI
ncbi:MAG: putative phosphatase [uncultured marine phage]|uniref:Putative phosphatase n=1 Tax=uncultured marine phage TaxID=707152 RepID=A0A8D9C9V5_9VIRU|nr:MAG: putative phosphatase [uncultured marine phage]